jgi:hypothetical protein
VFPNPQKERKRQGRIASTKPPNFRAKPKRESSSRPHDHNSDLGQFKLNMIRPRLHQHLTARGHHCNRYLHVVVTVSAGCTGCPRPCSRSCTSAASPALCGAGAPALVVRACLVAIHGSAVPAAAVVVRAALMAIL